MTTEGPQDQVLRSDQDIVAQNLEAVASSPEEEESKFHAPVGDRDPVLGCFAPW